MVIGSTKLKNMIRKKNIGVWVIYSGVWAIYILVAISITMLSLMSFLFLILIIIPLVSTLVVFLIWCIYLHIVKLTKTHPPEEYELMELV